MVLQLTSVFVLVSFTDNTELPERARALSVTDTNTKTDVNFGIKSVTVKGSF